jgi:perilipin-2
MEMERKMEMEKKVEGYTMVQKLRYCESLESLVDKLCLWAYHQALSRVKEATQKRQETISQLQKI